MKRISKKNNQWLSNKPGISDPVLAPTVPPEAETVALSVEFSVSKSKNFFPDRAAVLSTRTSLL